MAEVRCGKCGVYQDPDAPVCAHLLGKKGGTTVLLKYGRDFYRRNGRKGGAATLAAYGQEHYRAAGEKGGSTTRAKGPGHYRDAGKKGGAVQHERAEQAERKRDEALVDGEEAAS